MELVTGEKGGGGGGGWCWYSSRHSRFRYEVKMVKFRQWSIYHDKEPLVHTEQNNVWLSQTGWTV
jgi:hypothetical protein